MHVGERVWTVSSGYYCMSYLLLPQSLCELFEFKHHLWGSLTCKCLPCVVCYENSPIPFVYRAVRVDVWCIIQMMGNLK